MDGVDGMDGAYDAFFSFLFVSFLLFFTVIPDHPRLDPFPSLPSCSIPLLPTYFLLGDCAHVPEAPTPRTLQVATCSVAPG